MPHLDAMHWNVNNELHKIENGTMEAFYQYSGGQRVRKWVDKGSVKEERIYLGNFEIYRKFDNTSSLIIERTTVHVSDDSGRIAMLEKRTFGLAADDNNTAATLVRYIYSNHLQSASLELDDNADIISYEEYHPYGTTSYQAMNAAINAVAKRYRYTGKERDEESGLYYHGARYYIPWLCRWTAVDPLESKYAGMSPYNYAFNNPVMYNDPSGMEGEGVHKGNWVRTADNRMVYNSLIDDVDDAVRTYGEGSELRKVGYSYRSKEENDIVLGINGKFTENGVAMTSPDDKANYVEGFWEGFWKSVAVGTLDFLVYMMDNPNVPSMTGTKLDGSNYTVEDMERYGNTWTTIRDLPTTLDPEKQIYNFSYNLVYGTGGLIEGIYNNDGQLFAQSIPQFTSTVGTIYGLKGLRGMPSGQSKYITVFKNTGVNEMNSLKNNYFNFQPTPSGTPKYFWMEKSGLDAWNKTDFGNKPFNLEIKIKKSFLENKGKDFYLEYDNLPMGSYQMMIIPNESLKQFNKSISNIKIKK